MYCAEGFIMDNPSRVRRDCMRAQIRRALVKRIVEGHYQPGDRLIELQIAREFNTSQGPVREALRELEALRLVETETYRGTRVRAISEREMGEAAMVRGALEQFAAQRAAVVLKGNAEPLRETLNALRKAAAARDLDTYAAQNMAFHRHIVQASGNSVLLRVWDSLMLEVRTRIGLTQLALDPAAVAETHFPILQALEAGDGETAGRLLREHAEQFHWDDQSRTNTAAPALLAATLEPTPRRLDQGKQGV
jgi:DNA-binding GntR family transcriptional regulator